VELNALRSSSSLTESEYGEIIDALSSRKEFPVHSSSTWVRKGSRKV